MATRAKGRANSSPNKLTKADKQQIVNTVRALSPEFLTVSACVVEQYIDIFAPLVGRKVFGDKYFLAMALLVLHKMKMAGLGDNQYGTVDESYRFSSISVGDETVSFNNAAAASTSIDSEYLSTSYGRQYLDVKKRLPPSIHIGGMRV